VSLKIPNTIVTMSNSRLFQPLKLGSIELRNRVAMAPLTRFRASDDHSILPIAAEYYGQRASVPGTLLITEATYISKQHGGYPNVPGIYEQEQIAAWKHVTDEVHRRGVSSFCNSGLLDVLRIRILQRRTISQ
jgi:NADPH2 dehydrogenase